MELVIVTGPPGSGKTTLARPLAQRLRFPLLSKDDIKESLADVIAPPDDRVAWSRALGAATFEVMWKVAPMFERLVLEANLWRSHKDIVAGLAATPVEVYCRCPYDEAAARFATRAARRHSVHAEPTMSRELYDRFSEPLAIGPVIEVDLRVPVDVAEIEGSVRRALKTA